MRKLMHAKESAKEQFANEMEATSQAMAELELREQEKARLQHVIERFQEFHSQLENAKHTNRFNARVTAVTPPPNPFERSAGERDKIAPHDVIHINVANAFPDQPIAEAFTVESMGTVALGPTYGRVKVAGLSILEAEDAVKHHLAKIIEDPQVQVTMQEKSVSGSFVPDEATRARATDRVTAVAIPPTDAADAPQFTGGITPARSTDEQFRQAVMQELDALHRQIMKLQTENAELKKQLEQKDKSPSVVR
jgi:protein involved in polysaccharide export with SLBB domain